MKKIIVLYALLVFIIVFAALLKIGGGANLFKNISTRETTARINGREFKLLLAKTDTELIRGLSGRPSLPDDQGMLFVFKEKGLYPFWMKDMKFPIDIIFIDESRIDSIVENAQPPKPGEDLSNLPIYRPKNPVNYVLEINGGLARKYHFLEGDTVELRNIK